MKKKIALLAAAALAIGVLTGCGEAENKESSAAESSVSADLPASVDLDSFSDVAENKAVEEYVTLGEYKGVEVSVAKQAASEEEIQATALQIYLESITADNGGIKDRAVENGDTANIDYVGKKDGVAFDGGTASGYDLGIGSGSFIPGFEEGLVGVKPGETVDINLSFPENYHSPELAGQAVVFTVTVNYILPAEIDDKVVKAFGYEEFSNAEELNTYAAEYLNEQYEAEFQSEAEYAVLSAVVNNAAFVEVPEELIEKQKSLINETLNMYASYYGISADDYTSYFFNMDAASFVELQAEDYAKQQLVYQAIANAEGLNVSDRELEETLLQYASKQGAASVEEFLGDTDREEYRDSLMIQKVYDFVHENAVIKEAAK